MIVKLIVSQYPALIQSEMKDESETQLASQLADSILASSLCKDQSQSISGAECGEVESGSQDPEESKSEGRSNIDMDCRPLNEKATVDTNSNDDDNSTNNTLKSQFTPGE